MTALPLNTFREDRPLAESIAIATRPIHAKLNKLIIARLPLVLPPHAASPFVYASGLLHIAPIYQTFESVWSDIISGSVDHALPREPSDLSGMSSAGRDEFPKPDVSTALLETLDMLYLPGLMRTDSLVADIRSMTAWSEDKTREQLDVVSKIGRLAEFVKHIRRAIRSKPHVLLAYSYIMFMALFSGGRFIRATLESAGNEFWDEPCPVIPTASQRSEREGGKVTTKLTAQPQQPGFSPQTVHGISLQFFQFDTPLDGEDLKNDFKQRLADAEESLSNREKHDIVQEAICIFENMILVVAQLDNVMGKPNYQTFDRQGSADSPTTGVRMPSTNRFRDSVAVTKERSARGARGSSNRTPGNSEVETCSSGDRNTPSIVEDALPAEPDNHPIIPPAIDMEQCPASSKSVRFEKSLPQPSRSHLGAGNSAGDLAESLKMASRRLHREQVTNWVIGVAIGFIILGAVFSGRRASSSE
ncbi:hypothetical protein QQS21_008573 [Conoideocrella luteorostrata]|uniref:Hem oxygenase-like, multi-helical n=1 Tax=Conoideocrella luteorostrata TaxID=1105319 RepID=A0AAJ0CIL0_9HYPO|nr:hypothetical protein QQS21_008573 [Conoideocrella luteorostrata]